MTSVIFAEFDFLEINNQTLNVSLTLIMNMFQTGTWKHATAAIKCKCSEFKPLDEEIQKLSGSKGII